MTIQTEEKSISENSVGREHGLNDYENTVRKLQAHEVNTATQETVKGVRDENTVVKDEDAKEHKM